MTDSQPVAAASASERRKGDIIQIEGDYQHRALLHGPPVQRFWHRTKLNLLKWRLIPAPGERVLDIGCGSGVFSNELREAGARVVAVDANPAAAKYVRDTFAKDKLTIIRALMDELPFAPGSFDKCVCLEVIEHVYPPQVRALLRDLYQLLRPGGQILLTTPNYRGFWPVIEWLADHGGSTAKMDSEQHITRFHKKMLQQYLVEAGFVNITIRNHSTFAPFSAAISWKLAEKIERAERKVNLPFGNILTAVATRPADARSSS